MAKQLFLIVFLVSIMTVNAQTLSGGDTELSAVDAALNYVKSQFKRVDADYYLIEDSIQNAWSFFVDAEPQKGWEHEAYICIVQKPTLTFSKNVNMRMFKQTTPPSGNLLPMDVKNRYGNNAGQIPFVKQVTSDDENRGIAQRTYAVIVSGGINKVANHERYWNDCSFIYQTLTNKYGVPKENIFAAMADGTNPAEDTRCSIGGFKSQSLDLDFDGVAEIKYSATKDNIASILNNISWNIQKDDQLFIFVIDHGGSTDKMSNSYICLWNGERLYDYELADYLTPFTSRLVNVNVVLGQCYSGGFIDDLQKVGCVISTASQGNETSRACSDIPFDEFVYQWTCAVNEANYKGGAVASDTDNNGSVTMDETIVDVYKFKI